jgi:hypothetical protein
MRSRFFLSLSGSSAFTLHVEFNLTLPGVGVAPLTRASAASFDERLGHMLQQKLSQQGNQISAGLELSSAVKTSSEQGNIGEHDREDVVINEHVL